MAQRRNVPAAPAITAWPQADSALAELRTLAAQSAELEARKDRALAAVKAHWDPKITPLLTQAAALEKALQEFALTHQADLDARSRKLSNGTVGFRLGNPALATLPKWTWAKVLTVVFPAAALDRLTRFAARVTPWGRFVRVEISLDKPALLKEPPAALKTIGCRIAQEERFYYELHSEPAKETT